MKVVIQILFTGLFVTLCLALLLQLCLDGQEDGSASFPGPSERAAAPATVQGQQEASEKEAHHLLIAVLSAREHFGRRQTVRETWLRDLPQQLHGQVNRIKVDFVLGGQSCRVPKELRQDELTCKRKAPRLHDGQTVAAININPKSLAEHHFLDVLTSPEPVGIDFEFKEDAVITHLGVYDHDQDGIHNQIPVSVYDSVSGKEIVKAVFHLNENSDDIVHDNGFVYKPVTNFAFPKGFLGSVVAGNFSQRDPAVKLLQPVGNTTVEESSMLMRLRLQSRRGGEVGQLPIMVENIVGHAPRYLAASFKYMEHPQRAADMASSLQDKLEAMHQQKLQEENAKLMLEESQFGDIMFVPLLDTYQNLPRKLLLYFAHVVQHRTFKYLLKTDDDCLVNVTGVLAGLASMGNLRRAWWGRFRREWGVERFGKWQELLFTGKVYPPFACGSGNVLSQDLVQWLAANQEHLHCYQGEDVSLGIWLAAIGVRHLDDECWICSLPYMQKMSNQTEFLAIPNLEEKEMRRLWRKFTSDSF